MTSSTCSDIKGCSATSEGTATTSNQPEECKSVTAPVYSTFVTEKVDSSASTTEKITTSICSDVTGCSAPPSSTAITTTSSVASPGPTLAIYDIHARQDVPWEVTTAFTERLKNDTKPETLYIAQSEMAKVVICWRQYLTPEQAEEYKQDPAVRITILKCASAGTKKVQVGAVRADSNDYFDDGLTISYDFITQRRESNFEEKGGVRKRIVPVVPLTQTEFSPDGVAEDLKPISLPDKVQLSDVNNYAYRSEVPDYARIYILDSGMDTSTPVLLHTSKVALLVSEPAWLFPGENFLQGQSGFDFQKVRNNHNPTLHGTCIASKAAGEPFGVSKKAAITIVRLPKSVQTPQEQQAGKSPGSRLWVIVDALKLVWADIQERDARIISVISLYISLTNNDARSNLDDLPKYGDTLFPLFEIMQRITNMGSSFVVSGGNYGIAENSGADTKIIRHVPAIWNDVLPLIVVGAVNERGNRLPIQPYKPNPLWPEAKIDVYALGAPATCASNEGVYSLLPGGAGNTLGHESQVNVGSSPGTNAFGYEVAKVVKDYVVRKAIKRSAWNTADCPVNVAYNGEIPQLKTGMFAFGGPNVPPFKREEGSPVCLAPESPSEPSSSDDQSASFFPTETRDTSFQSTTKDTTRPADFNVSTSVTSQLSTSISSSTSEVSSVVTPDTTSGTLSTSLSSKLPDGFVPHHKLGDPSEPTPASSIVGDTFSSSKLPDGFVPHHGLGNPREPTPSPISTSLSETTPPPPVPTTIAPIPAPPSPPAPVQTQPVPPPNLPEAPNDPSCEKWSDCPQDMCAGKKGQSPQCFKKYCACF
ncbi:hypothetical protein HYALB_00009465 [Hymenoscyphus albidus]|uniref:Peptidase S8/S53 domain-containing protein n=1 Tax=Hymenoscyphus albidus TaxID=595503 RepID=A0A9N9LNX7_9HELO|nr:hypothetical protein HYALB_00009465 [Hymenoscyphus albidus]